jgi:hypothetical protein
MRLQRSCTYFWATTVMHLCPGYFLTSEPPLSFFCACTMHVSNNAITLLLIVQVMGPSLLKCAPLFPGY